MQIHRDIENYPGIPNAVVTIGTFDGVHLGHQQIINKITMLAKEIDGQTVLVTFDPHPRKVLFPGDLDLKMINTMSEKAQLLERAGIDHLVVVPFSREFSEQSPSDYVNNFIFKLLDPKIFVIGFNHRFGHNREGDIEFMRQASKKLGFRVEEIPKHLVEDISVSSTKIRKALFACDINKANQLLGSVFSLHGLVVKGDRRGHEIGFPTANLKVEDHEKIIPGAGVYAVKVWHNNSEYTGMMNIGTKPTILSEQVSESIEVNIFDFDKESRCRDKGLNTP
ncbi:MAG: riboflavin biosynthesis protein RibF [Bacteroidetes bacterium]|nr:riboflavin biosynthesis protein RibF [Bacteroidota bacterium]